MGLQFPSPDDEEEITYGVYPVDFLLETVLDQGLAWYLSDINNSKYVFGHLGKTWLSSKYGTAKINEIWSYLNKYKMPIVQHFSLIDQTRPCLSIQLLDGSEEVAKAALDDHAGVVDSFNNQNELEDRRNIRYSPILDNIHIGIHVTGTPDLAKYIYYLVIYILNAYKPQLEERGMDLSSFRATDISRLNDFLPENMYSRFVNFSCITKPAFDAGSVPLIDEFKGLSITEYPDQVLDVNDDPMPDCGETDVSAERVTDTFGLTVCTIKQEIE